MKWKTVAIACLGFAAVAAQAQVHRCKDGAGKVIFSDSPCSPGQTGEQIEGKRTRDEILGDRKNAHEAESRAKDRRLAEQDDRPRQQHSQTETQQLANDWQARKDRENAATSAASITANGGRWDERAEAERRAVARQSAAVVPVVIVRCVPGICYDNKGGAYYEAGPGMLRGPNGNTCHKAGTAWNCS